MKTQRILMNETRPSALRRLARMAGCGLLLADLALSTTTIASCSDDDDFEIGTQLSIGATGSGIMKYDGDLSRWYIRTYEAGTYDSSNMLFPNRLPKEFRQKDLKVHFTGDIYELNIADLDAPAGTETYYIRLKSIEKE